MQVINKSILPALLLYFSFSFGAFAQQALLDSLENELQLATTDSARLELHNQLAVNYYRTNPNKTLEHSQLAIQLADKAGNEPQKAKALNSKGVAHVILGQNPESLESHLQALALREKIKDTLGIVASYTNLGNAYIRSNYGDKALNMFTQAAFYAEAIGDELGMSRIYNNMGAVHKGKGNFDKAIEHYLKAAKLKEKHQDLYGMAVSLNNAGECYVISGQVHKGLEFIKKAIAIDEKTNNISSIIPTLRSLTAAYIQLKQYDEAIAAAKQSLAYAKQVQSNLEIMFSAQSVFEALKAKGDYKNAIDYLLMAIDYSSNVNEEKLLANMADISAKYETEKKELENLNLTEIKENQEKIIERNQQIQVLGIVAFLLLLALLMLLVISRRGINKKRKKLQVLYDQLSAQNQEIKSQQQKINHQNNELMLQHNKLEKLNDFQNKLFSIISHDLRNPFVSVKSLLNILGKKNIPEADMDRLLGLLHTNFDSAYNMLENLLLWSGAQMEGGNVNPEPVQLRQLASESIFLFEAQVQEKQITIRNQVQEQDCVLADKERLNFVVRNLLANALKFTPHQGRIFISTEKSGSQTIICVEDTGIGMSPKELENLRNGKRFSGTGTANEKGSGLGLMLCQEFIKSMGGTLELESEKGNGSRFKVFLPAVVKKECVTADADLA